MIGRSIEDFASYPETDHVFQLDMPGQDIAGMVLKPWDRRTRTTAQLQPLVQQNVAKIAGAQVVAFQPPPLPGTQGLPIQFIIGSTDPFSHLNDVAQKFLQDARASGLFIFLDTDLKIDKPQTDGGDRSQQDRAARPQDERCRQRADGDAGRRLRELLRPRRAFLQGDPAGAATLPAQRRAVAELPCADRERGVRAAVHRRAHHHPHRAAVAQPLPAGQRRDDPGRGGAWRGSRHGGGSSCRISPRANCRRAIRSITAGCRGNTCRSPAGSCSRSASR